MYQELRQPQSTDEQEKPSMSIRKSTLAIFVLAGIVLVMGLLLRQRDMTSSVRAEAKTEMPATPAAPGVVTPVLVELYTSEGCSSCPPADALLARLGKNQPVPGADLIVLEEHVDYWDRLGWKDPFSSAAMTTRQSEYAQAFGDGQVYTPEMVVDGRTGFVGSSAAAAMRAIFTAGASAKLPLQLAWDENGKLSIHASQLTGSTPGDQAEVVLAVSESMLHSNVKRGENSGRALDHTGVVRRLDEVGKINAHSPEFSSTVDVPAAPDWNRANLRAVVFVQEHRSRHVLAAAAIPFPAD
jgi:hypothetical protein